MLGNVTNESFPVSHTAGQAVLFGCSIHADLQSQKFKNTSPCPSGVIIYGLVQQFAVWIQETT